MAPQGGGNGELKCAICGCTESRACPEGCLWADLRFVPICTVCDEFAKQLSWYVQSCNAVSGASLKRLLKIALGGAAQLAKEVTTP